MKHRYGDVIKVLANTEISHGMTLTNGKTYDIRRATENGVYIVDDRGESFIVPKSQLQYTEIVKEESGMKWEIGEKLRVINANAILEGYALKDGQVYEVISVDSDGLPVIYPEPYGDFSFISREMAYIERAFDEEDTERNTELGEPSADCNCVTLSEIYDEIVDMKAMIGRLIRNGGDEE